MHVVEMINRRAWLVVVALLLPCLAWADLQFDEQTVTIKPQPLDVTATGQYHFTNTGTAPVKISVRTSCGCTTAELPKDTYAPGEAGIITASFKFSREAGAHEQRKQIFVTAEDPKESSYVLNLVAQVPEYVQITPGVLTWQLKDPPTPKIATLKVMTGDTINVTGVTVASADKFTTEVKTITAGREYQILVTPTAPGARAASTLTVQTDFPAGQPFSFGFFAHVSAPPKPVPPAPWYDRLLVTLLGWLPGR